MQKTTYILKVIVTGEDEQKNGDALDDILYQADHFTAPGCFDWEIVDYSTEDVADVFADE